MVDTARPWAVWACRLASYSTFWLAHPRGRCTRVASPSRHTASPARHTYATWLEDAGIPARVIDAYMGHAGGRTPEHGSRIGRVYRETTDEMRLRVVAALEERLAIVLKIAEEKAACSAFPDRLAGGSHRL
jgi:hypothetical protein